MKKLTKVGKWFFTITTIIFSVIVYLISMKTDSTLIAAICAVWLFLGQILTLSMIWGE